MTAAIKHGSTDVSLEGRFVDPATGLALTVDHATAGLDLWYRRPGGSKVTITPAALASLTASHVDGGVEPIGDGWSRIDLPDLAFASGADRLLWGGSCTGGVLLTAPVALVAYDSQTDALGANKTAPLDADGTRTALGMTSANLDAQLDALGLAIGGLPAPLDADGTRTALGMTSANLDAQLDAILAAGGGGPSGAPKYILPISAAERVRGSGSHYEIAIGESAAIAFNTLIDADGNEIDLDAAGTLTLYLSTTDETAANVQTVADADITPFGSPTKSSLSFLPNSAVYSTARVLAWSLREAIGSTNKEIAHGTLGVIRSAFS